MDSALAVKHSCKLYQRIPETFWSCCVNESWRWNQFYWHRLTISAASSAEDMANAICCIAIRIPRSGRWLALRLTAGCSCHTWTDTLTILCGIEGCMWNHVKQYWFSGNS
jgi:hypothetical protein